MFEDSIIYLFIGFIGGLISSLFGIGSGAVVTPLLLFLGVPALNAVGSVSAYIFSAALVGFLNHLHEGNVEKKLGILLGMLGMVGGVLGVVFIRSVPVPAMVLRILFVPVLLFSIFVINSFFSFPRISWFLTGCVAGLAGFLAACLGIGGGVLMVPLLIAIGLGEKKAVGTSLLYISLAAFSNTLFHSFLNRSINPLISISLAMTAPFGSRLGVWLLKVLPVRVWRALISAIFVVIIIRFLFPITSSRVVVHSLYGLLGELGMALSTLFANALVSMLLYWLIRKFSQAKNFN